MAPLVLTALWQHSFAPFDKGGLDPQALALAHADVVLRGVGRAGWSVMKRFALAALAVIILIVGVLLWSRAPGGDGVGARGTEVSDASWLGRVVARLRGGARDGRL